MELLGMTPARARTLSFSTVWTDRHGRSHLREQDAYSLALLLATGDEWLAHPKFRSYATSRTERRDVLWCAELAALLAYGDSEAGELHKTIKDSGEYRHWESFNGAPLESVVTEIRGPARPLKEFVTLLEWLVVQWGTPKLLSQLSPAGTQRNQGKGRPTSAFSAAPTADSLEEWYSRFWFFVGLVGDETLLPQTQQKKGKGDDNFCSNFHFTWIPVFCGAAKGGHLRLLKRFETNFVQSIVWVPVNDAVASSARGRRQSQWVDESKDKDDKEQTCQVTYGKLTCFDYGVRGERPDLVIPLLIQLGFPFHQTIHCLAALVDEGQTDAVKLLLSLGVPPNGSKEAVKPLTIFSDRDPKPRLVSCPLTAAARQGNLQLVELLLQSGASPDGPCYQCEYVDPEDLQTAALPKRLAASYTTPLVESVRSGQFLAAQILLSRGADPNLSCGSDQATPLICALRAKNLPMVELLMSHAPRPDLTAMDAHGQTAIVVVLRSKWEAGAMYLLDNYPQESLANGGSMALLLAIQMKSLTLVNKILNSRFTKSHYNNLPYAVEACKTGSIELLSTLIDAGVNVNAKSSTGQTALEVARQLGDRGMESLLRRAMKVSGKSADRN
jgi:ankyrin repeat protein